MPRTSRCAPGGMVFHVLNRGVGRRTLFDKDGDYAAFERIMREALARFPMRVLAYCLMPNHWHQVLWPREDHHLTDYLRWLTHTHTQRHHAHHHTAGTGHLYQGRFKSFPVETDEHLLVVCRYVERNALRANLAPRAQDWRWGSLWRRSAGIGTDVLSEWPAEIPRDWIDRVNQPQSETELQAVRQSLHRSCPFGGDRWREQTASQLGIQSTLRPRGRPRRLAELPRSDAVIL